jgi:hypothetical protein
MSWLFGVIGRFSAAETEKFGAIHGKPIHKIQSNNIYITAGGIKETCFCSTEMEPSNLSSGWLACGVGIYHEGTQFSLMTSARWQKLLSQPSPPLHDLNGHFVVVKWTENQVTCYTDQLGFRNLFLTQLGDYSAFSTRLDWLTKLRGDCQINFEEFGSRWLLVNQLSQESIVTDIERLTQGGVAECTPASITVKNHPWEPNIPFDPPNANFEDILRDLVLFPLKNNQKLSLALSGGVDSRVLLSILLSGKLENWSLHTVGDAEDPDVQTAKRISEHLNVDHQIFNPSIPNPHQAPDLIRDYVGQTMVRLPASHFVKHLYYSSLHDQNMMVIDGGQGEVVRREFFNQLRFRGGKILTDGNIEDIFPLIFRERAPIFNDEIMKTMKDNALAKIGKLREDLPPVKSVGLAHWLDLFIILTGFPNTTNLEQSRSDAELVNFAPFAQPSLLRKLFSVPVSERNNGKMFFRIIKQSQKYLVRYKRVKNGVALPFQLSTLASRVFINLNHKLGRNYSESTPARFLESLSDFVQDAARSTAVRNFEYYDHTGILKMVDGFYGGSKGLEHELDWWLAFEMWRQTVYGK